MSTQHERKKRSRSGGGSMITQSSTGFTTTIKERVREQQQTGVPITLDELIENKRYKKKLKLKILI